jgi:hypothetical protein
MNWTEIRGTPVNLDNATSIHEFEPAGMCKKHGIIIGYVGDTDNHEFFEFNTEALRDAELMRLRDAIGLGGTDDDQS